MASGNNYRSENFFDNFFANYSVILHNFALGVTTVEYSIGRTQ